MHTITTYTAELAGTSYEIGRQLGKVIGAVPALRAHHTSGMEGFGPREVDEAVRMFDRWVPGLTGELTGLADELGVPPEQLVFYGMTSLTPRCSHIAVLPGLSAEGKPLLARNYEYCHEAEDFCLVKTAVQGKHAHMGTSVLQFGRDDGFNERGLAVTMSSCGFPVGPLPGMRAPKVRGLQFWAVTRALLENCSDVDEALGWLEEMPIAFNINLIVLDRTGRAALFETLDGRRAVKRLDPGGAQQTVHATNHAVLPELAPVEPEAMIHSVRRYDYIRERLAGKTSLTREELKAMLLAPYPDGLCCHFYEEYFGTTKSMLLSPADGTIELCWGGRAENGWNRYDFAQPLGTGAREAQLELCKAAPGTFGWQPMP